MALVPGGLKSSVLGPGRSEFFEIFSQGQTSESDIDGVPDYTENNL
jgi:hypothetical protein